MTILAHPECPPEVVAEADFTGSTADMSDYVGREKPARVVLLTECSMADNVSVHHPAVDFVRPCNLCPHMKRITLPKIRRALETMRHEVTIDPAIAAARAGRSSACWRFEGCAGRCRVRSAAARDHDRTARCARRCWRISAAPAI